MIFESLLVAAAVATTAPKMPVLHVTEKPLQTMGRVPLGAQRVPMLALEFQNSCDGASKVTSILLHHEGLGNVSDLERVYAIRGLRRITRAVPVSDNGDIRLRFSSFILPPCGTSELMIVADISPDALASSKHRLVLENASSIESNTPIEFKPSQEASVPKSTAATVQGSIDVEFLPITTPLRFGPQKTVARVRMTADAQNDQLIDAITFTNDGSAADSDLQNIVLTTSSGKKLTNVAATMDSDIVRLEFPTPFLLGRNETVLWNLKADIRASRKRTVRFTVEEPSDVEAHIRQGRSSL